MTGGRDRPAARSLKYVTKVWQAGLCRTHHILKHHPDWNLQQIAPGVFTWTTPAGRTYTTTPDAHAA
jgi:hypothetical protein